MIRPKWFLLRLQYSTSNPCTFVQFCVYGLWFGWFLLWFVMLFCDCILVLSFKYGVYFVFYRTQRIKQCMFVTAAKNMVICECDVLCAVINKVFFDIWCFAACCTYLSIFLVLYVLTLWYVLFGMILRICRHQLCQSQRLVFNLTESVKSNWLKKIATSNAKEMRWL